MRLIKILTCALLCLAMAGTALADPANDAAAGAGEIMIPSKTQKSTAQTIGNTEGNATPAGQDPVIPAGAEWPEGMTEDGFLPEGEFVWADPENGIWRYCSSTLRVEIIRRSAEEPRKLIWYEAEVFAGEGENWGNAPAVEGKHFSESRWPYLVTSENGCVLAINGDYACGRWANKNARIGIIIRDGEIFWSKTKPSDYKGFPNLDTLALYEDGNMEVHNSDELTAQEYIDRGAVNVYSFGPWLIRDGEINPKAYTFGTENAPRSAIGMVEKGHYWAVVLEGRRKASKGASIGWMAELMASKGVSVAFNLDGGETACMCFMGRQLNVVGGAANKLGSARRESEFLFIGTSALVDGYKGN